MKFLRDDYFLTSDSAKRLYAAIADLPIFDYHCHLSPAVIAADEPFKDLAELWLAGDHYKWRLMRANGADESLCSGKASWDDKFAAFAATMPQAAGNPIQQWSHLELKRFYGIDEVLCPSNAASIRKRANAVISERGDRPSSYMEKMKVAVVCTTDDPIDDLSAHAAIAADPRRKTRVLPTFRPDKAGACENPAVWNAYVDSLGAAADTDIASWKDLATALGRRHEHFHKLGCRLSDHALLVPVAEFATIEKLDRIVASLRSGREPNHAEADALRTALLGETARLNHDRGWAMQLHTGALRNTRGSLFRSYGADGGGDCMTDRPIIEPLAAFLDSLDRDGILPRLVLYSLDSAENDALAALAGCFQGGEPGKVLVGAAWWFDDQEDGMTRHLASLASIGLLGRFLGMLTDSRSFLSYPRHEYWRRLLCGRLGAWIESGLMPADEAYSTELARALAWGNASTWFGIEAPAWARKA